MAIVQLIRLKPKVVVGMSGTDAWITGFAAYLTRKPLVVIDPNAIPCNTARNLAHMARLVFTAFRVPMEYLRPDKCAPRTCQ
jgi:UDP-N-acetylglucosamine:LPS N-acetylglucosamine transferase